MTMPEYDEEFWLDHNLYPWLDEQECTPISDTEPYEEPPQWWGDEAMNLLVGYVTSGVEFPEAFDKTIADLKLSSEQAGELKDLYDQE
jgi:hypothetical protein